VSGLGGRVKDSDLKHREAALQLDRAVLGALAGAELGLDATIDFEGETIFRQFGRSVGHSKSVSGSAMSDLVTVIPARPTRLFWETKL
jgi:hypothetical protein